MATKVTSLNISPDLKIAMADVAFDLSEVNAPTVSLVADMAATRAQVVALVADVAAIRTQVVALVTDMATRISEFNTLTAKLNLDAGVADTNYATAVAKTAVAPAAQTSTAPAAQTSTAPAASRVTV